MHTANIAHRDIKPENILIEDPQKLLIKITDFGFAKYFNEKDKMKEVLGSPIYMPPEIVDQKNYDEKVDIWSTGVVVYIMLCGKIPFEGRDKQSVYESIKTKEPNMSTSDWLKISENAKDFCRKALTKDPTERASADQLLKHPWLSDDQERQSALSKNQPEASQKLDAAAKNMGEFCSKTNFQRTISSILAGLKVQKEELQSLQEVFRVLDADQNGTLSLDELRNGLKDICLFELLQDHTKDSRDNSKQYSPKESDEYQIIMDRCDLDNDGKIDYNEFIQAAVDH